MSGEGPTTPIAERLRTHSGKLLDSDEFTWIDDARLLLYEAAIRIEERGRG